MQRVCQWGKLAQNAVFGLFAAGGEPVVYEYRTPAFQIETGDDRPGAPSPPAYRLVTSTGGDSSPHGTS